MSLVPPEAIPGLDQKLAEPGVAFVHLSDEPSASA